MLIELVELDCDIESEEVIPLRADDTCNSFLTGVIFHVGAWECTI